MHILPFCKCASKYLFGTGTGLTPQIVKIYHNGKKQGWNLLSWPSYSTVGLFPPLPSSHFFFLIYFSSKNYFKSLLGSTKIKNKTRLKDFWSDLSPFGERWPSGVQSHHIYRNISPFTLAFIQPHLLLGSLVCQILGINQYLQLLLLKACLWVGQADKILQLREEYTYKKNVELGECEGKVEEGWKH